VEVPTICARVSRRGRPPHAAQLRFAADAALAFARPALLKPGTLGRREHVRGCVVPPTGMRWAFVTILLTTGLSCAAPPPPASHPASAATAKRSIHGGAPDPGHRLSPAKRYQPSSESLAPPQSRSARFNTGACLEPLEPAYQLSARWTELRRGLDLDQNALVMLAIAPAFQQPYALSLHRRPAGAYFLRVTRLDTSASAPVARDGAIDSGTARLVLDLWSALLSRVQVVQSDEVSLDGRAYYFSAGAVTGYAANPRNDGVLDRTFFALDWLGRLVEEPGREDPTDRQFIRSELEEALARTRAGEPCVRVVSE
jgi:hypothetical protein